MRKKIDSQLKTTHVSAYFETIHSAYTFRKMALITVGCTPLPIYKGEREQLVLQSLLFYGTVMMGSEQDQVCKYI